MRLRRGRLRAPADAGARRGGGRERARRPRLAGGDAASVAGVGESRRCWEAGGSRGGQGVGVVTRGSGGGGGLAAVQRARVRGRGRGRGRCAACPARPAQQRPLFYFFYFLFFLFDVYDV